MAKEVKRATNGKFTKKESATPVYMHNGIVLKLENKRYGK